MGTKYSTNPNTQLSSVNSSIYNQNGQIFEKEPCNCLIMKAKKNPKTTLVWETNAIKYCEELKGKQEWVWASEIINIVKNRNMSRTKFISDFNHLKYMEKDINHSQKQLSLTPAEIHNFKLNLRKSVLLQYGDVCNPTKSSKIQQTQPNSTAVKINKSDIGSDIFLEQINLINDDKNSMIIGNRQPLNKSKIKSSKIFLRDSVVNLVEDTMSSLFKGQQKQISKYSAHALDMFIKFTLMLEKHLTNPDHKIYEIIQSFCENMYKNYKNQNKNKVIINSKPRKLSGISDISAMELEALIKDIKKFIVLLNQMIFDYYNVGAMGYGQEGDNHLINNYQNIKSIITAIMFKDEKFYNFVFGAIKQFNKENEERIQQKYYQLHGKPPENFSIRRQYCLNNASFKKFIEEMSSIESNIENFIPDELQSQSEQPYIKCSEALCKIAKARTPIAKMKTILECAELITQTISQFYQTNSMKLQNQILDADQVLSIFCYILSLNKIDNLFSHMFLIDKFATEQQKMSMTGYYFTVIKCAIEEDFGQNEQDYENQVIEFVVQDENGKENLELQNFKPDRKRSKDNTFIQIEKKDDTLKQSNQNIRKTSYTSN